MIKNIFIEQLPSKNIFGTRKKYLRSIHGLVWLKLCWGKDLDHEKMENLGNTKECLMQPNRRKARINAIDGKWIEWSRRKPFVKSRSPEPGIENFRHAGNNNKI